MFLKFAKLVPVFILACWASAFCHAGEIQHAISVSFGALEPLSSPLNNGQAPIGVIRYEWMKGNRGSFRIEAGTIGDINISSKSTPDGTLSFPSYFVAQGLVKGKPGKNHITSYGIVGLGFYNYEWNLPDIDVKGSRDQFGSTLGFGVEFQKGDRIAFPVEMVWHIVNIQVDEVRSLQSYTSLGISLTAGVKFIFGGGKIQPQ